MKKNLRLPLILSSLVVILTFLHGCTEDGLSPVANTIAFHPRISQYGIYKGEPSLLIPADQYHLYEISTELFTDYALKQRLISVPEGASMISNGDGLPSFPDGTMLVKTFYYYHDGRDPSKGRKLVETRLMIKSGDRWNVATYYWNDAQTEAQLITTGINRTINWVDDNGKARVISYHIPSNRECSTCHHSNGEIIPIGPKLRNLNRKIVRDSETVDQLTHLVNIGLLQGDANLSTTAKLPDWKDDSSTLEQRARAYLDVNCGHCHSSDGIAGDTNLRLNFESSYGQSRIGNNKQSLINRMENGTMPRIGTSVIHEEGIELIRSYINSL